MASRVNLDDQPIQKLSVLWSRQKSPQLQKHHNFVYQVSRMFKKLPSMSTLLCIIHSVLANAENPTHARHRSLPVVPCIRWCSSANPVGFQEQPRSLPNNTPSKSSYNTPEKYLVAVLILTTPNALAMSRAISFEYLVYTRNAAPSHLPQEIFMFVGTRAFQILITSKVGEDLKISLYKDY